MLSRAVRALTKLPYIFGDNENSAPDYTGVCIILATLKRPELTSIFVSGFIHSVLELTSVYGSYFSPRCKDYTSSCSL